MILRPLEPAPASKQEFLPAWQVVLDLQLRKYESCWLITQPSHAALAGELAASVSVLQLPTLDKALIQAIALHDAGWGMPDAQAIQQSRSKQKFEPQSFIQMPAPTFLTAWQKSIETAQSVSSAGGYIVSRHFHRLAEHRVASAEDSPQDHKKLEAFLKSERQRQEKLAASQSLDQKQLELLTDLLQFCDLLSLYMCSGARQNVVLPRYFDLEVSVRNEGDHLKLAPAVIRQGSEYSVAALRHPALKGETSRQIDLRIG